MNLIRVSITGPESTGKSWLAEKLAGHYNTNRVPEFARSYLDKLGREYVFEDIAVIALEQLKREESIASRSQRVLFCDTDPLVTKIWSDFKFGRCDPVIADLVINHRYDLYLLCDIDLPWEEDPLRENPGDREELFTLYRDALEGLKVRYRVVSGTGDSRLQNAISAVDKTLGITV